MVAFQVSRTRKQTPSWAGIGKKPGPSPRKVKLLLPRQKGVKPEATADEPCRQTHVQEREGSKLGH